ncbi:MAG: DUF1501 domain-containing protein [Planctomycetia bacterium]
MNPLWSGMSRRHFVKHVGAAGMALPMMNWIDSVHAARAAGKAAKNRSMILLWMGGGPATIDLWDLKPESKNGGEFKPIATTGAGQICEHMPQMAKVMKHLNILRSYNSRDGAHERGTYIGHTAFAPVPTVVHPAIGAVAAKYNTPGEFEIPGHISLAGPGVSPGFLGTNFAPFRVNAGNDPIPNLRPPVAEDRFARRKEVLEKVETQFVKQRRGELPTDHETIYGKTFNLMTSKALDAFKIDREDKGTLDRYGDSQFGRNCLLARRLVEIGVPFIEVGFGGWDMHQGIFNALAGTGNAMGGMNRGMPHLAQLDKGFASLIEDLNQRDLLKTTTICWMGDFGRTPKINQDGGRDHWPGCWSVVVGGGGMKGGEVIGATDKDGVTIADRPVDVSNLFASLYKSMGIDPQTELRSPNGRPIKLVGTFGDGKVVDELF